MINSKCWVIVKKEPQACAELVQVCLDRTRAKAIMKKLENQLDKGAKTLYNIEEVPLDELKFCTCERCWDLRDKKDRTFQEEGDR